MKFYIPSEYQAKASSIFRELKKVLLLSLPEADIQHIGSSAINGAISKGDLDIFAGISRDKFDKAIKHLNTLGFKIKEDTLRTESLCMLESPEYEIDVAVQLVERGSKFEDFLKFRDQLNARPELVKKYNVLKKESKDLKPEEYRIKKSKFIFEVLKNS